MGVPDENGAQWFEWEHEELVSRLRRLEWPTASQEARRRCWEQLTRRMAELDAERRVDGAGADGADPERRPQPRMRSSLGQRYEFSRPGLAQRLAPAQSWSRLHSPRTLLSTT